MKRFFLYKLVSLSAALLFMVTGCKEGVAVEDGVRPSLEVSPRSLEFEAAGNVLTVTVTTDGDSWNFSENPSWAECSRKGDLLTVKVAANTGSYRESSIRIAAVNGNMENVYRLPVFQQGNDNPGELTPDGLIIFEDEVFKEMMVSACDVDRDGEISTTEAERVKTLDVSYSADDADNAASPITSLKGIRYFKNLTSLECEFNSIRELDLSGLDKLQYLYCNDNLIESLNIEGCTALTVIYCRKNRIPSIKAKGVCDGLKLFDAEFNELTELDLSDMKELKYVVCANNNLTSLNLSGSTKIHTLAFHQNGLSGIALEGLVMLDYIKCNGNNLVSLDVTMLPELRLLECHDNLLMKLDMSKNTKLQSLICYGNDIKELKVAGCTELGTFDCSENNISELALAGMDKLKSLTCGGNPIEELGLESCSAMEKLICDNMKLSSLVVSNMPKLNELVCNGNMLTVLDISENSLLQALNCLDNPLTKLYMKEEQHVKLKTFLVDDTGVIEYK